MRFQLISILAHFSVITLEFLLWLLVVFCSREGAIDRLVGIYKDVVHKTGVSIFSSVFDPGKTSSLHVRCLSAGLPDAGRLREP